MLHPAFIWIGDHGVFRVYEETIMENQKNPAAAAVAAMMAERQRRTVAQNVVLYVALCGLLALGAYAALSYALDRFLLSRFAEKLGPGLEVSRVLDQKSNCQGCFLPSGSEFTVTLYELPQAQATQIRRDGIAALQSMTRPHLEWAPTPVVDFIKPDIWSWNARRGRFRVRYLLIEPSVEPQMDYLSIIVDPQLKHLVEGILSTPGSFYTRVNYHEFVIVAPEEKRVISLFLK
jgi:hypothetical protein